MRGAFFGVEALRVQRGREEVRVYVRLPKASRQSITDLYDLRIALPDGAYVPLEQVAHIAESRSPSTINRLDGSRVVTITADVDDRVVTGQEVTQLVETQIAPQLLKAFPNARIGFGGESEEAGDFASSLKRNFSLALFIVFTLLALPFRSYSQPIIVMLAIPFGFIGALIGHIIMGLPIGILSIFGLVGLAGVVINAALVQVDYANVLRRQGTAPQDAWVAAGKARFRPIFLTAITTFLGVAPLLFEQSMQAQFLVPMATSIAFGVLLGTFIQMLCVPALGAMVDSVKHGDFRI